MRFPNNRNMHMSDTVCAKCRIPPCCSSVLTGLVMRTSSERRTVHGVEDTLNRIVVRNISAGVSCRCRVLGRGGFVSKSVSIRFVKKVVGRATWCIWGSQERSRVSSFAGRGGTKDAKEGLRGVWWVQYNGLGE